LSQETWQNDLYEQLAAGSAAEVNPIAGSLLQTLDDHRYQSLRTALLDDMHLYPGASTLEVGCGPGMLLEGMHERVGAEGKITGIDLNRHFINVANRRVKMLEYDNATFVTGDCHSLPFEDGSFDAVVAEKVLMHVSPISRVIEEMKRVLSVGGRLVLSDYDPYTIMTAGPDPALTARVLASAAKMYASPYAARETVRACLDAGLYMEKVRGHLLVLEDPQSKTVAGIANVWYEHAASGRQVDRGTARRWLKAIEMTAREGRFMIAIPNIITVASKVR
jgi:ubiquinone/menaquinone biosynthesis C-methylase UbiE